MSPIPRLARWLLSVVAPAPDRDAIVSEFADEAADLARRSGVRPARAWYWRQTRLSIGPLLAQRWFPSHVPTAGVPVPLSLSGLWFGLAGDLRQALRRLRRTPAFTFVAVLTLALGLGANTAVFTLVNAVILAPLPVPNPDALYRLGDNANCCVNSGLAGDYSIFSTPLFEHLQSSLADFTALAAFQAQPRSMGLRRGNAPSEPVLTSYVSTNYFAMLEVRPSAGHLWDDDGRLVDGAVPVVVSQDAWLTHFQSDPAAIGSTFTLNGTPAVLVGVMPAAFFGETRRADPPELWLPVTAEPLLQGKNSLRDAVGQNWLYVMGRLRPGASPASVGAAATGVLQTWIGSHLDLTAADRVSLPKQYIVVTSARGGVSLLRYSTEESLRVLAIAAAAVLLIACANLANLLLVRGLGRRHEVALRVALGAPRTRLIRESLLDTAVLGALGALISLAVASAGATRLIRLAFPSAARMPVASTATWPVLAFAIATAAAAALLCGVLPALLTSRLDATDISRGSSRMVGDQGGWARRGLVIVQVALSLALVTSAGLLVKNIYGLETQSFGFESDGRFLVAFDPTLGGTAPGALPALYERLEDRLRRVPGVRRVSLSLYGPMVGNNWSSHVLVDGHEHDAGFSASWDRVTSEHFETVGTPILRGRTFDARDTATSERVAVVNETFARTVLGTSDPIGRRFGLAVDASHARDFVVVGLVGDAKYASPRGNALATFFLPFFQNVPYTAAEDLSTQTRSNYAGDVEIWAQPTSSIERDIRAAVAAAEPNLSIRRFLSMPDALALNFWRERLVASLAGLFAALALLLACVGLYGVTAYSVSRRVREIGVRMALGADRARIMRGVMTSALITTGLGLIVGVAASLAAGRLLQEQLFGVSKTDATVLLASGALLIVATALASLLPARRAATIDPIVALRAD